jgi:DNA-directed RNA polymerase specialized sigma24 family protein
MSETLKRVKRAAKAKRRAEQSYQDAIVAAHEAGDGFAAIAEAAGIARQSARELIHPRQRRRKTTEQRG